MEYYKKVAIYCWCLALLAISVAGQEARRLIVEEPEYDEEFFDDNHSAFYRKFFKVVDTTFDLLVDTSIYSLQQIELSYHISYPYSLAVYIGFILFSIYIVSKILSFLSKPKVFSLLSHLIQQNYR